MTAAKRGHEIWYIGAGDFACDPDDALRAHACRVPAGEPDRLAFLKGMDPERLTVHDLDLLGLRKAPADDLRDRFWAQTAGALFGGLASVDSLTRVDFHEIVLAALEDRLSRWKGRGQGG